MLDNPAQRELAARKIVVDSRSEDERPRLLQEAMRYGSIRLDFPIRSVPEVKRLAHEMALLFREIAADLGERRGASDQTLLFGVKGRLEQLRIRLHRTRQGVEPLKTRRKAFWKREEER